MQYGGYGGTVHWVRYGGFTVRYRYRGYDGYSTVHRITTVPTRTFKIAYSKQIACYSQQAGKLPGAVRCGTVRYGAVRWGTVRWVRWVRYGRYSGYGGYGAV